MSSFAYTAVVSMLRCPRTSAISLREAPARRRRVAAVCRLCRDRNRRHSTAVGLLQAGVDRAVIALWLGHESVETTQMYLDADLAMKERALARVAPLHVSPKRFRPRDRLLAFLEGL